MEIYEPHYRWAYDPGRRSRTDWLILHHAAGTGSPERIHALHRDGKGWAGIAYHYYVRLDGQICRGRPEDWNGGHTGGYNGVSLGVCFEGNFEEQTMPPAQLKAGRLLISDILRRWPGLQVARHCDLNCTACPGRNFPLAELLEQEREEEKTVFQRLSDVPENYRAVIRTLMERGALTGRADPDPENLEDNILDLSEDYCRVMSTLSRLGVI